MQRRSSRLAVLAALGALTASLGACGSSPPTSDAGSSTDAALRTDAPAGGDGGAASCTGAACPRVTQLAIGYQFTVALLADGSVRAWGRNGSGQCGDGTTDARPRPVTVSGLGGVTQVAAGYEHACAVKGDGTVWCWGGGAFGRLGNGSTNDARAPVQVMGVTGATQVATGYGHACAVINNGTVRCWGRGGEIGARSSSMTAVEVAGLSGVARIAASAPATFGGSVAPFTCAVKMDGSVWCWGSNDSGQLATGTTDNLPSSTAPLATLITSGAQRLAAGGAHACALLGDGAVRCWGNDLAYQLGDPSQSNRPTPVALAGLAGARDLALGRDTTCGLFADGTARCLGANGSGQLGRGSASSGGVRAELMAAPVAGLTNIQALALGEDHACAYTADGATRCWGANAFAQLGIGVEGDAQYAPTPVAW
jgi:alpha-tubulin suppressor-like RCC1 family protein